MDVFEDVIGDAEEYLAVNAIHVGSLEDGWHAEM